MTGARALQEPNLVLLRHGASEGNVADRFTGRLDEPLSELGRQESVIAGFRLAATDIVPTRVWTSRLSRATDTARILLDTMRLTVPVTATERLDERHYGVLQGKSRGAMAELHGEELVHTWRRSLTVGPPGGESIADVVQRARPVWHAIRDELDRGETVLVVSHGNTLRALARLVVGDESSGIIRLEIPTGGYLTYAIGSHTHRMQSDTMNREGTHKDARAAVRGL